MNANSLHPSPVSGVNSEYTATSCMARFLPVPQDPIQHIEIQLDGLPTNHGNVYE